ncbi:hypothetical protein IIA94_01680 [Patescibacteria group bacterium]|nr:hypothetical protein [Patescibacteria group bacterium]
MVAEDIINSSSEFIPALIIELGTLASWLQALGILLVVWLVFQVISLIVNLKKKKLLELIRSDINKLERKVDRISKKK